MIRRLVPALFACLLITAGVPATADDADAGFASDTSTADLLGQADRAHERGDDEAERAFLDQALSAVGDRSVGALPIYERLRRLYADSGEFTQAIRVENIELELARGRGQRHGLLVSLVSHYAALHQLDNARAALAELENGMSDLRSSKHWAMKGAWWQAQLDKAKASLETQAGHFDRAENAWRACLSGADASLRIDPGREGAGLFVDCSRGLLDVLIDSGRLAEAGQVADQMRVAADRMVELKGRNGVRIRVNLALGRLAIEQGQPDLARRLLLGAVSDLESQGVGGASLREAGSYKLLADLAMLQGDWAQALQWHKKREHLILAMQGEHGKVGAFSPEYAYALLRTGKTAEALAMLRKVAAGRDALYEADSLYALEGHAFLGVGLYAAGQRAEARHELQKAIPKLLALVNGERSSNEAGALRTARLNWLLEGYIALLADYATGVVPDVNPAEATAASDEAFRMADLARGSTVQRALAAAASRTRISDPVLAEMARREQDLLREASALAESIGNLLARGRIAEEDAVVASMRTQLARLRKDHDTALLSIEQRFPDYANLLDPKPVGIADLQALLKSSEAIVSIYTTHDRTFVWAIPAQGAPLLSVVNLSAQQLEGKVAALRDALDPATDVIADLPDFPFSISHELYERLLAPVVAGWHDAKELITIQQGPLARLPLGVLTTQVFSARPSKLAYAQMADAPWLIKQVAITDLPTAMALPALRAQENVPSAPRPFAGFGDPIFSTQQGALPGVRGATRSAIRRRSLLPSGAAHAEENADEHPLVAAPDFSLLPPLPDTAQEVDDVARALSADPQRDVFLERRASEAVLKHTDLSAYRVLMFATHGLTGGDMPGLYQPALAFSNPRITGDGEDGLLTMDEVLALRLNADWVVLSACNSAAAGERSGESLSGLARAFFYAGARSLLVTNWAVETESARLLTTKIFRLQATDPGLSRARALQQSSLALMHQSAGSEFSYAHPMFWAPYTLVGASQ